MGGWDILITDNEIGFFSVSAVGPAAGGSYYSGATVLTENEDRTWVTPQFGGSIVAGGLLGNSLNSSVTNYRGTAQLAGATLFGFIGEKLSSVSPTTGLVNNEISGMVFGFASGLPELEGHLIYTNALFRSNISNWLTSIFK